MSKKHYKNKQSNSKNKEIALPLIIRQHPAVKRPWLTAVIVLFLLLMIFSMFSSKGGWSSLLVPAVLLVVILHGLIPYFVPTTYTFTKEQIEVRRFGKPSVFKWDDYRAYSMQSNGFVLWMEMHPASKSSSFSKYFKSLRNSVFIPLDEESMQIVEPLISRKLVKTD
ncbi:MAG: hypothetical protein ACI376_01880 [Candidatus Bruticola sp.]